MMGEPTVTHHYHPKSVFISGFAVSVVYSVGLYTFIMKPVHHYYITEGIFTALRIFCALPFHPSLHP